MDVETGGEGRSNNSPYSMSRSYGNANFFPIAKNYKSEEWRALSPQQKQQIQDLKVSDGWVNGYTPPHGFTLNDEGLAIPSTHLVTSVQHSMIGAASTYGAQNNEHPMIRLPPVPTNGISPVPPIINTNANHAGAAFGRGGSRTNPRGDNSVSQVSMISINGQSYGGPVYDANGNRLA